MLARRSRLEHDRISLDLPLLVPSFSSKGSFFERSGDGSIRYEVAEDLRAFALSPTKSVLVSAFDLFFRNLDLDPDQSDSQSVHQRLYQAELVFLDSGGYELAAGFDSCEGRHVHSPTTSTNQITEFNSRAYSSIIAAMLEDISLPPLVAVNFDHETRGQSFDVQREQAQRLLAPFLDRVLPSFLLKPTTPHSDMIDLDGISDSQLATLRPFAVIGATEKEIGVKMSDQLKFIARLRQRLDTLHIGAPIHIWGGLDPVVTCLYFFAGAQIFDGVSWLRYAFVDGVAQSRQSYPVLTASAGFTHGNGIIRAHINQHNRLQLDNLRLSLQQWVDHGGRDFSMFAAPIRDCLRRSYEQMTSVIKGV